MGPDFQLLVWLALQVLMGPDLKVLVWLALQVLMRPDRLRYANQRH